jgi:hypothetical protein
MVPLDEILYIRTVSYSSRQHKKLLMGFPRGDRGEPTPTGRRQHLRVLYVAGGNHLKKAAEFFLKAICHEIFSLFFDRRPPPLCLTLFIP